MDAWSSLWQGFAAAISPLNLLFALLGSIAGTIVGVLPGLGPTAAIAMLLPLAALLDPAPAIIMMAAIYYGAMYGGSTTSIIVNIPGEASSVPTAIEGYQRYLRRHDPLRHPWLFFRFDPRMRSSGNFFFSL